MTVRRLSNESAHGRNWLKTKSFAEGLGGNQFSQPSPTSDAPLTAPCPSFASKSQTPVRVY